MNAKPLKKQIIDVLWRVADQRDEILSATLTGSFVNSETLAGLSDIDLVVVVEELNDTSFRAMQNAFQTALEPILQRAGYSFLLNPTLGPLKFNAPNLAVLHLMVYSRQAHVDHVIQSPFTCLDWQQSSYFRKHPLVDVYPAFGLQPRHFFSARRSISDYLSDLRQSQVSYRKLHCDERGYREEKRVRPMDGRDRHEFCYHIMRFLMLNLLKLIGRYQPRHAELTALMDDFFDVFPNGKDDARGLLWELARKKHQIDFDQPIERLNSRVEQFVSYFEQQFRHEFVDNATHHIVFRHAETHLNHGEPRFLGRSNPSILSIESKRWKRLEKAIAATGADRAFTSPLDRCQQSLKRVWPADRQIHVDERLIEINYGRCEALTVAECRSEHFQLFDSWHRGEDPRFPDGENSSDVTQRLHDFAEKNWTGAGANTVVCTHNVVLRSLVGEVLSVPPSERFRLQIPHLAPLHVVANQRFGLFLNLDGETEREMFRSFDASH